MTYNSGKKFGKRASKGAKRRSRLKPVKANKTPFKGKAITKQQSFLTFDVTDEKGDITDASLNRLDEALRSAGDNIEHTFMLVSAVGGNDLFHCWHEGNPSYTDKVARYAFAVSKKDTKGMLQTPHFDMMMRLLSLLEKHPKHTFLFLTGYKDKQVKTVHFPGAKMITMQYVRKYGYIGQKQVMVTDENNVPVLDDLKRPQFQSQAQYAPFSSLLPNVFFTVGIDSMEWKDALVNSFYVSSEFNLLNGAWSHTPTFWDVKRAFIVSISEKDNLRYDRRAWGEFLKHSWILFDLDNCPAEKLPKLRQFIKLANRDELAVNIMSMPTEWVKGEGKEVTDANIEELEANIKSFEEDTQMSEENIRAMTTIHQRDIENLKTGQYPMVWPSNMQIRQYPIIERTEKAQAQIQKRDAIIEAKKKAKEAELKKGGLTEGIAPALSVVRDEPVKESAIVE